MWFTPGQLLGLETDEQTEAERIAAAEAMYRADQEARRKLTNSPIVKREKPKP